jgi:hypothetical protein
MQSVRLNKDEKQFVQDILNNAVLSVGMRDRKRCCESACLAILGDRRVYAIATAMLRPVILAKLTASREHFFNGMLDKNVAYAAMPKPLRAEALYSAARELGLVIHDESNRVDVETIKEECHLAKARMVMNMAGEVGRECQRKLMHKKKVNECIKRIVDKARRTGVADVTIAWREFASLPDILKKLALKAIKIVSRLTNVYVLDIHGMKCLFPYEVFKQWIDKITNSTIFAINMGEDEMILDVPHFSLLAAKIRDGSLALRRWFVECNDQRRVTLTQCGHLSKPQSRRRKGNVTTPNVFTIARRVDKAMWAEGLRSEPRLSWLSAPEKAYNAARKFNTRLQDSTCNWDKACALREAVEHANPVVTLATVA